MKRLLVVLASPSSRSPTGASSVPIRAQKGMVASQNEIASRIGADVISAGGNAVDAAVATAFALAVTHPTAGNIGGGGFIVYRPATGEPVAYDFREMAPAKASPTMWLKDGKYNSDLHHNSHLVGRRARHGRRPAPGVEGTGQAAVEAARRCRRSRSRATASRSPTAWRDRSRACSARCRSIPASLAQFSKNGVPYEAGETLKQPDLARTLERIADAGPGRLLRGRDRAAHREGDDARTAASSRART